jgi:hypothetical protein
LGWKASPLYCTVNLSQAFPAGKAFLSESLRCTCAIQVAGYIVAFASSAVSH